MTRILSTKLIFAFIALALSCASTKAQTSQCSNSNNCGHPTVTEPWGYYQWQVDFGTTTTTLKTETGFSTAPTGGGFSTGVFTLTNARTIHEVHGAVAFTVWPGGSCGVGSVIAEVHDQLGNSIATVWLENLTNNSVINIPIKATFPNGLAVSGLNLTSYSSQCSATTLSWSLVMN